MPYGRNREEDEMETRDQATDQDLELAAMATVYSALKSLDAEAQSRVLDYVAKRLSLKDHVIPPTDSAQKQRGQSDKGEAATAEKASAEPDRRDSFSEEAAEGLAGVSPVAKKWMQRNGFSETQLSSLFSLGVDEIDLVAPSVKGKSKREKFRNVLLLQGIASYLGSGAARVDNNKLKQAAGHYGADPERNMWNYIKSLASEVSGSSASGFTLTARGMNSATELIKELTIKK
jgi:hypothetical protein